MKPADENRTASKLAWAILEAFLNAKTWMGGAVVIRNGRDYDAHPGAYMNDISYTGSRDAVFAVEDPSDWLGGDTSLEDFDSEDELLDYINEMVIPNIER
jgi:hypothetical protein